MGASIAKPKARYNAPNLTKGLPISLSHDAFLTHFQTFYRRHMPLGMEDAIAFFAVFGGLKGSADLSKPLWENVQTLILERYAELYKTVGFEVGREAAVQNFLSALALGDGQIIAAFKRAKLARPEGMQLVQTLCNAGILRREPSMDSEHISDKLYFASPFIRFWFAFVSPLYKGIKEGMFEEVQTLFTHKIQEFTALVFEQLCREALILQFAHDPLVDVGSYWDKTTAIELLGRTTSGQIIACSVKYTRHKLKKSHLSDLKARAEKAQIKPHLFGLFSLEGFSKELKTLKSDTVRLWGPNALKCLIE